MNKKTFFKNVLCLMTLFFTMILYAQSEPKVLIITENPLIEAAPNLPKMERSTEGGKLFYGVKFTYKADENKKTLKDWTVNYPSEVVDYKVAIAKYLKDTDVSKLSAADQNTFYDLKSQWLMVMQLIN